MTRHHAAADRSAELRSASLFAVVPDDELREIADKVIARRFAAGQAIVREGEPAEDCHVVVSGTAGVVTRDLIGQDLTLTTFGPGDTFGEMALVSEQPRSATVVALTEVETLSIGRSDLERLEERCPRFAVQVRRQVDLLDIETFLRRASPFARLPLDVLRRLVGQLRRDRYSTGRTIVREGEPGDRFYLLRSGRLEVTRGGRALQQLEPGDCFGEIALLTGGPRVATVRAVADSELLSLSKSDFDAIVREQRTVVARLAELARIRFPAAAGQLLAVPDPVTTLMPYLEPVRRRRFWWLLFAGVAAFVVLAVLSIATEAPPLAYLALAAGAFVGPVVYVVFLADSQVLPDRPHRLVVAFLLAAALGLPLAIVVEGATGARIGELGPALLVSVIEELAKVTGVVWLLRRAASRFQMDGVVYGAAAGMGFAGFETALYGLQHVDEVRRLVLTLGFRALLSPFGHGTWTALVSAAIWRQKGGHLGRFDLGVIGALALAVALHALWDWQPFGGAAGLIWLLAVGTLGILALRQVIHAATREETSSLLALDPELARGSAGPATSCASCGQLSPAGAHYCARCGRALRR